MKGGNIPTEEELLAEDSSDSEDSIGKEEPSKPRAKPSRKEKSSKPRAKPSRKSTSSTSQTFSLVDGITGHSKKQKRHSLPERLPTRIQPRRGSKEQPSFEDESQSKPPARSQSKDSNLDHEDQKPSASPRKSSHVQPRKEQAVKSQESGKGKAVVVLKRRVSSRQIEKQPPATFENLGEDDLCRIASFLPSIDDLTSLKLSSKQTNTALSNVPDEVYRGLYIQQFGTDTEESGDHNVNWTWQERWTKVLDLKAGFRSGSAATIIETSVGVLRWEKEEAALFEDNPQIAPVDRDVSIGYVGLKALNNLPKPPIVDNIWDPPLILHGAFNGIKIYDSAKGLLSGKRRA
jgi:hypothetical protein